MTVPGEEWNNSVDIVVSRTLVTLGEFRETEVEDLHIAFGADHDVLGFDVTMDDACFVRRSVLRRLELRCRARRRVS